MYVLSQTLLIPWSQRPAQNSIKQKGSVNICYTVDGWMDR